ncbi:UvrD-helicase domain-containing protein [Desemzia sp. FAM 24101]|uniref:UvrD-helicase domain-containing protein n=1 Tax=unclassified Desemzia TaxID=2685243 RepID=UPI003887AD58
MEIKIAGAGAGKTTKLAQKIIDRQLKNNGKIIYCVSFTNSSVNTIIDKLKNYYGEIPKNIKVSTIHSFLNSELINPYYFILYGKQFHHISNASLSDKPKFKNSELKRLEEKGFLHVDTFTAKAKYVMCGKSGDRKKHKETRGNIQDLFSKYFDALYVDEAQDIDKNFKEILMKFDELGLYVEVIGDPKQDLKGLGCLPELIREYSQEVTYIKESFRCPQCHLNFSNIFIGENEQQFSPQKRQGTLNYYFESEIDDLHKFIEKKNYDLKYIHQKNERFDTHAPRRMDNYLFNELKIVISSKEEKPISDILVIKSASTLAYELTKQVIVHKFKPEDAIKRTLPYGFVKPAEYYKILKALEIETNNVQNDKYIVRSIESVKGLGEKNCLFIVTPSIFPYILGQKIGGKIAANLYVGLTRSKENLDLLITIESEMKFSKENIASFFKNVI